MYDLKIFHVILKVVDGVLSQLTAKYGKVSELSISQGFMHDYLGMRLDYYTKGKVRIPIPKHIKSILEAASEDMDNILETPAANHLFTMREDEDILTGTQAELFRTLVEKYCSSAAIQDLT